MHLTLLYIMLLAAMVTSNTLPPRPEAADHKSSEAGTLYASYLVVHHAAGSDCGEQFASPQAAEEKGPLEEGLA